MSTFNENREALLEELFNDNTNTITCDHNTSNAKEGLRIKFIRLERLKKQELSRWWDFTILEKYTQIKQIPRGLRVILFPSFGDLNPALLQEWEQLLINSSLGIMDILIRDAKDKRECLLTDIKTLEKEIQDTNLPEAIDKNYHILNNVLQKHQEYIKEKKLHKLRRDGNDYAKGRVFTYARKFDNLNSDRQDNRATAIGPAGMPNATTSDTDLSSCSSFTSEDTNSLPPQQVTTSSNKSTFLLEMERFRRGQKHNKMPPTTHTREPEGARERVPEPVTNTTRVTTRSVARNLKT
ncbi:hypothetical protein NDU88_003217 [Pleurodeles waltl]|uniref:Uncharacterized protein n=1 Tax=Pleurodeles waltl TaxID=8319 RepID=A0AAV7MUZ5_PLEWA|nr:hypothetical protein NDU88_003217 [Pleurodeles waltl]